MENQTTSKQLMINYGLLLGLISVLINVVLFAMGKIYEPHWSVGVLAFVITAVVLVMGIKKYKEINGGFLKLGEAIKIGLGIALISGIIAVIYNLIFTNFIEPQYYINMAEVQQQKMLETYPNMSDEQLDAAMEMTKKMSGPGMAAAMAIIGSLFIGFIISLIAGLIMKKSDEEINSI
jgi:hypothetical protein